MTDPSLSPIPERPHPALRTYWLLTSLVAGPFAPVLAVYLLFRFRTLRYRVDAEGISMSWGVLFRRETIIQFSRIQDIHLRSNVVERHLGLARILLQTASGSSDAEMTLEGLVNAEEVRDFLYGRLRGIREPATSAPAVPADPASAASGHAELAAALREAAAELRALRETLAASKGDPR